MLKAIVTNMFFILAAALLLLASRHYAVPPVVFGALLVIYLLVLFCGAYFIQANFFLRSVLRGDPSVKQIAISFDDGPAGACTIELLDILAAHAAPAAFFCIGKNIVGQEEILRRMILEGHLVGNHSGSHGFFFDLLPARKMLADLQSMDAATLQAIEKKPLLFRPPYGVTNPAVARAVRLGNYQSVGWSVRSMDTVTKEPEKLFQRMMAALAPGKIFLFHDTSDATRQMLGKFLDAVRLQGYAIVRLDKMCKLKPYA